MLATNDRRPTEANSAKGQEPATSRDVQGDGSVVGLINWRPTLKFMLCCLLGLGDYSVFHRTVAFDVQEVEPGLWRWNIFPGNRVIQGPAHFRTRERAVEACHREINDGIERTRRQAISGG
jgi:hypothetical protein